MECLKSEDHALRQKLANQVREESTHSSLIEKTLKQSKELKNYCIIKGRNTMSDNNTDQNLISIKILDRNYQIKCPSDQAQALQEAVTYVEEEMRKYDRQ